MIYHDDPSILDRFLSFCFVLSVFAFVGFAVVFLSGCEPAATVIETPDPTPVCPVSGEPLGSMGEPIGVMVNGELVYICCEGCRKPLLDDPAKYLGE